MLTINKLKIYSSYKGDIDGYARMMINKVPEISDKEWSLIDNFLQDLLLANRGKASESFRNKLFQKLKENCETQEVINKLIQLSS